MVLVAIIVWIVAAADFVYVRRTCDQSPFRKTQATGIVLGATASLVVIIVREWRLSLMELELFYIPAFCMAVAGVAFYSKTIFMRANSRRDKTNG